METDALLQENGQASRRACYQCAHMVSRPLFFVSVRVHSFLLYHIIFESDVDEFPQVPAPKELQVLIR